MSALVASSVSTVLALVAFAVTSAARARASVAIPATTTAPTAVKATKTNWYAPAFVTFGHAHGHRRPPS